MKNTARLLVLVAFASLFSSSALAINSEEAKLKGRTYDLRHTVAAVAQLMGICGVSTAKSFGDSSVTTVYKVQNVKPSTAAFRLRQIFLGKAVTVEVDEKAKALVIVGPQSMGAQLKSEMSKIDMPKG